MPCPCGRTAWSRLGSPVVLFTLLLAALAAGFAGALLAGSEPVPPCEVWAILGGGGGGDEGRRQIVLLYRLPKALTALLAGAALGVAGLQMQTVFRNPLADPFVLGVSSGASLGVALLLLGAGPLAAAWGALGDLSLVAAAAAGAAAVVLLVVLASRVVESHMTILILGMLAGYAVGALVSVLMQGSDPARLQGFILWGFGSFADVTWERLAVLAPVVAGCLLGGLALLKGMNALLLGESYARSLGVEVRTLRLAVIAAASLLTGAVTAFCGPVAFIGIAVPHLARGLLRTSDHRLVYPACALLGAVVALVAEAATHLPGGGRVLPLNAVTCLFGAPVVMWLVLRRGETLRAMDG